MKLRLRRTPGPDRTVPYRPGEGRELPGRQEAALEAGRQLPLGHGLVRPRIPGLA